MIYSGINWWIGVVEDVFDPLKLGRCRIRILGIHTENKQMLPTEHLPWAHPVLPITSAGLNGIGFSPHGVLPGSHVIGFFRDGESCQEPVYTGVISGIPQELPDPNIGFNDPYGIYPKEGHLLEPDTNRLARNENLESTIVQDKIDSRVTNQPIANDSESTWEEPESAYDPDYPANKVFESSSGHIIEVDDTQNKERLNIHHKSGTFTEIGPDGTQVSKIVGEDYKIVESNSHILIQGKCNANLESESSLVVNDNIEIESKNGHITIVVKNGDISCSVENGNLLSYVTGDVKQYITGNVEERIAGSKKEKIDGNLILDCSGTVTIKGATINLN